MVWVVMFMCWGERKLGFFLFLKEKEAKRTFAKKLKLFHLFALRRKQIQQRLRRRDYAKLLGGRDTNGNFTGIISDQRRYLPPAEGRL